MDNLDYIKSLEERIEKLENFINTILLDSKSNIHFSNCSIQTIAMEKCKDTTFTDVDVQNLAQASFTTKIDNCTIHNCETTNGKVKFSNCSIGNKKDK